MKTGMFLLLPALFLTACIETGPSGLAKERLPIIGGVPDESPGHQAVVGILSRGAMCTGTLISPRVVLTAAHCLYGLGEAESFSVMFGDRFAGAIQRRVAEIRVHPDYRSNRLVYDIGMMRLASDPPAGVVPIPYLPHRIGLTQEDIGLDIEYVGFGQTDTGESQTKMTVTNQLEWICVSDSVCELDFGLVTFPNTICTDNVPGGTCSGDSGGPSLIVRNDQEYVAGVTSFGDENCAYYSCSTKVDEYEEFILGFAGDPQGTDCEYDHHCLSGYCRDGVCCDSDCPGRCQACNQEGQAGTCLPLPDGTPCPDSDKCNGQETCQQGTCRAGTPLVCTDEIQCTFDTCNPAQGCRFEPLATECEDLNMCTRDICDQQTGCRHEPMPDNIPCGECQICRAGDCIPDPACQDSGCTSSGRSGHLCWILFLLLVVIPAIRRTGGQSINSRRD